MGLLKEETLDYATASKIFINNTVQDIAIYLDMQDLTLIATKLFGYETLPDEPAVAVEHLKRLMDATSTEYSEVYRFQLAERLFGPSVNQSNDEELCRASFEFAKDVVLRLTREEKNSSHLHLLVCKNDSFLKDIPISAYHSSDEISGYEFDNIGSGEKEDGTYCLAFAVSEIDDERDIPYSKVFAMYVFRDGRVEVVDQQGWSNSETDSYYAFDVRSKDFKYLTFDATGHEV